MLSPEKIKNLKVGDTIYVVSTAGRNPYGKNELVAKIGRQYIHTKHYKILKENSRQKSLHGATYNAEAFDDEDGYNQHGISAKHRRKIIAAIEVSFPKYGQTNLPIDKLERILAIINEK